MFKQCEKCGKTVFGINERLTKLGGHLYCPTCREIRIGKESYLCGIACLSCHAEKVVIGGSVLGSSGVVLIIISSVCLAIGAFVGAGFAILGIAGIAVAIMRRRKVLRCTKCKSVFTMKDVIGVSPNSGPEKKYPAGVVLIVAAVVLFSIIYFGGLGAEEADRASAQRRAAHASEIQDAIEHGQLVLGMNGEQVRAAWGAPQKKNISFSPGLTREQWVYGNGRYAYIYNGVLASFDL